VTGGALRGFADEMAAPPVDASALEAKASHLKHAATVEKHGEVRADPAFAAYKALYTAHGGDLAAISAVSGCAHPQIAATSHRGKRRPAALLRLPAAALSPQYFTVLRIRAAAC
jgi:hypothetical protein